MAWASIALLLLSTKCQQVYRRRSLCSSSLVWAACAFFVLRWVTHDPSKGECIYEWIIVSAD